MSVSPGIPVEKKMFSVPDNIQQLIFGDNNVQKLYVGCNITYASPSERPVWERCSKLEIKPRKPKRFLNRKAAIQRVETEIQNGQSLIFLGESGIGKSALIESLAYIVQDAQFSDGLYYLSALDRPLEDLLQDLFSAFYDSNVAAIPNRMQIQKHLAKIKALILIDDLQLDKDELNVLLNTAPQCVFVLASSQHEPQPKVESLVLQGLPEKEAQKLFEQAIRRPLSQEEKQISLEICRLLKGHPGFILFIAGKIREEAFKLTEMLPSLRAKSPEVFVRESIQDSDEIERQVLLMLAAVEGHLLPEEHVHEILEAEEDKEKAAFAQLVDRGLIEKLDNAYSLSETILKLVTQMFDTSSIEDLLIKYFIDWLENKALDQIEDEILGAVLELTKKAAQRGRWLETIRLGKSIESFVFRRGYWKTWELILDLILKAARNVVDRKVEAWALHQLGSRLLCLDKPAEARKLLKQAASIRQEIGDMAGLEITQQNLSLLPKAVMPAIKPLSNLPKLLPLWAGIGSLGVLSLVIFGVLFFYRPASPLLDNPEENYIIATTRAPHFEWQTVFMGENYQIQVDDQSDFSSPEFDTTDTSTSQIPDDMFEQGVYYWRVRGISRYNKTGSWSNTQQFTISIPPEKPTLIQPNNGGRITGTSPPRLRWDNVEYGIIYQIQVDDNSDFSSPEYVSELEDINTPITSNLKLGDYYWKVRAVNMYDTPGAWSEPWKFSFDIPPDTPRLSNPKDGDMINAIADSAFDWQDVEYGDTYQVQIDDDDDFSSPEMDKTISSSNFSVTENLAQGDYYWRVRAFNRYGTSSQWGDPWQFTLSVPPKAPILVLPKDQEVFDTTTISDLEWEEVENGVYYEVQIDNDASFASPDFVDETKETIVEINREFDLGVYYWQVRAFNVFETSGEWSTTREFVISLRPGIPNIIEPVSGDLIETTIRPAFRWENVAYADRYQLQIDNDYSFTSPIIDEDVSGTNQTISTDLAQGVYYWRVRAFNEFDLDGNWSTRPRFTVSIPPGIPSTEEPDDDELITTTSPTFRWTSAENAVRYYLEVDHEASFDTPDFYFTTVNLEATAIAGLLDEGTNYWRVQALNAYSTPGKWSATHEFRISLPPGVPVLINPNSDAVVTTTTRPTLSWQPVSGGDVYHLQVDDSSSFNSPLVDSDDLTSTSETLSNNLVQGEYFWRVRAINKDEIEGNWSSARVFYISIPPGAPNLNSPADSSSTAYNPSGVTFDWDYVSNSVEYQLYIESPQFPSEVFTTSGTSYYVDDSIIEDSCPDNPKIFWRVRAINNYGTFGPWSETWEFTYRYDCIG